MKTEPVSETLGFFEKLDDGQSHPPPSKKTVPVNFSHAVFSLFIQMSIQGCRPWFGSAWSG
jgi:hypothetical protein